MLIVVAVVFPVAAIVRRERSLAAWGWAAMPAIGILLFIATPGSAGYYINGSLVPSVQFLSLRYLLPFLPLCTVLLAAELSRRPSHVDFLTTGGTLLLALVSLAAITAWYPDVSSGYMSWSSFALAAAVLAGTLALRTRLGAVSLLAPGVAAIVLSAAWAPALASGYEQARLGSLPFEPAAEHLRDSDTSVAVAGFCEIYALYGPDLTRRVEYLTGSDDGLSRPLATTYSDWIGSLAAHRVTAVVIGRDVCFGDQDVVQADWARLHPENFARGYSDPQSTVYHFRSQ
jgi:hypothetical protein